MVRAFIATAIFFISVSVSAQKPAREPWDTCIFVEGKDEVCHAAEKARKFEDYLNIDWSFDPIDGFTLNSGFNLVKTPEHKVKPVWREVGELAGTKFRSMKYLVDDATDGVKVILAQRNDGLWMPQLKIAGDLSEPTIAHNGAIIAISRNFGGNVPMVRTWAWAATAAGPRFVDADRAPTEAIAKVSAGPWACYTTEMEWDALHNRTWCWLGEWPNKAGVHYQLDTWFELRSASLVPARVVLLNMNPGGETKVWP